MKCKCHCRWDNSQAAILQLQVGIQLLFLNQFPEVLLRDEAFYVYFSLGMNSCWNGCLAEQFDLHPEQSSFSLGCSSWTAISHCCKCLNAQVPFGFRGQDSRITVVYSNVDAHVAHVLLLFFYLFPRDTTILQGASFPHLIYLFMLLITVKSQFFFKECILTHWIMSWYNGHYTDLVSQGYWTRSCISITKENKIK